MIALFDSVAMMLRIKLAAQVDTEVALLGATNPLERIKIAARLADLLQQLTGENVPAADPLQVERSGRGRAGAAQATDQPAH